MKTKKTELEMDFIGGEGPLTADEEKALGRFLKKRKIALTKKITKIELWASKLPNITA